MAIQITKRKINITLILFFTCFNSISQPVFQKIFGVTNDNLFANHFVQTSDSGFVITGVYSSFSGSGVDNVLLLKTNNSGNLLWAKNYGGAGYENGKCVQQTTDGGYIIAANTGGSFGAGGNDIYLIKTNSTGTLLWSKTFGGTLDDFANSVLQTADGGYLVAGLTRSYGAGSEDMYLIKTDAGGNLIWSKVIGSVGGDWINSVQYTNDGKYIFTGRIYSGGLSNYYDIFLMKTDTSGNIIWIKSYNTGNGDHEGLSCSQTTDNGFIICGNATDFSTLNQDICVIKTDSSGNLQWSKIMDSGTIDKGSCIRELNNGGYIICGSTDGTPDALLINIGSTGNIQWSRRYGGNNNDAASEVIQLNDGTYIFSGMTQNFAFGDGSVYLVKTDANGVSDCNEANISFTATSSTAQVMIPSYTTTSGGMANTPATNTVSGGVQTTLCSSSVGMNELKNDDTFTISENQSLGKCVIAFKYIDKGELTINNVLVKKVFSMKINNESKKEISLQAMSSGIYLIRVFDGKEIFCKQFFVHHD